MTNRIHARKGKQTWRSLRGGVAVGTVVVLLAACGGFDHGPDPYEAQGDQIPVAAGSSIASFTSYIAGLSASETEEPLILDGFTAPTDETTEL